MDKGIYMERYSVSSQTGYALANGTAPDFHIIGAFQNYNSSSIPSGNNNGTITIKSGTYSRILAGTRNTTINYISHNITGTSSNPFKIKIIIDIQNSTTSTDYGHDINMLVGGQTDGSIYANSELDIKNGNVGRVLGGSIGYGDRTIYGYPANTYIGSTLINVTGGQIDELYGGSLGRSTQNAGDVYYYGTITINISGGTINQSVYGAGGGGATGYNSNSSDAYKSYGQNYTTSATVKITGGYINGNVYGGGYGYSAYLSDDLMAVDGGALYGNSYIDISGGEINGSIYGAGRGYDGFASKQALAQMTGNSNITVSRKSIYTWSYLWFRRRIFNICIYCKDDRKSYCNIKNKFGCKCIWWWKYSANRRHYKC